VQAFVCDACQQTSPTPTVVVEWDRVVDDDDELVWAEEAHLCSWQCLASWAMTQHLEMQ
jgi:hypothetical protein